MWVGVQLSTAREGNRLRFFFFSPRRTAESNSRERTHVWAPEKKFVRTVFVSLTGGEKSDGQEGLKKKFL